MKTDAADEAVVMPSSGTDRSRLESSTLAANKADDHNDNQSWSGQLQIFCGYFRFVLPLFGTPFLAFLFSLFIKRTLRFYDCNRILYISIS